MDPIDREVLALRHFEELTNAEAAAVLGLEQGGRQQALRPGPEAAQARSWRRMPGGSSTPEAEPTDPAAMTHGGPTHESTTVGPRPASTPGRGVPRPAAARRAARRREYADRYPELAERDPRAVPGARC